MKGYVDNKIKMELSVLSVDKVLCVETLCSNWKVYATDCSITPCLLKLILNGAIIF